MLSWIRRIRLFELCTDRSPSFWRPNEKMAVEREGAFSFWSLCRATNSCLTNLVEEIHKILHHPKMTFFVYWQNSRNITCPALWLAALLMSEYQNWSNRWENTYTGQDIKRQKILRNGQMWWQEKYHVAISSVSSYNNRTELWKTNGERVIGCEIEWIRKRAALSR